MPEERGPGSPGCARPLRGAARRRARRRGSVQGFGGASATISGGHRPRPRRPLPTGGMACTVAISPVMIIRVQTPITTSYPVLAREEYRDLSLRSRDIAIYFPPPLREE